MTMSVLNKFEFDYCWKTLLYHLHVIFILSGFPSYAPKRSYAPFQAFWDKRVVSSEFDWSNPVFSFHENCLLWLMEASIFSTLQQDSFSNEVKLLKTKVKQKTFLRINFIGWDFDETSQAVGLVRLFFRISREIKLIERFFAFPNPVDSYARN